MHLITTEEFNLKLMILMLYLDGTANNVVERIFIQAWRTN